MSEKIQIDWSFNVNVPNGPTIPASNKLSVDAYDKIEVVISAGSNKKVNVQPPDKAHLLLITVTDDYDAALTYTVTGGVSDVSLDGPHLFIGSGIEKLLGTTPEEFEFKNGTANDVTISVLVGRKVS